MKTSKETMAKALGINIINTTSENNKLIAEFMNHYENMGNLGLLYHSDWNWLMEVVEKIEAKKYFKKEIQFSITKYSVKIQSLANTDGEILSPCIFSAWGTYGGTDKIQAVYNACVEFIKWHNENNK
jgi:hypothetical protein